MDGVDIYFEGRVNKPCIDCRGGRGIRNDSHFFSLSTGMSKSGDIHRDRRDKRRHRQKNG